VRHAIRHDQELLLLAALRGELVRLGLNVGFRSALPGLTVTTHIPGVPLYVFVTESGTHYDWNNAAMRHPVHDPAGAAARISIFLRELTR
jgi:hypothetical protein